MKRRIVVSRTFTHDTHDDGLRCIDQRASSHDYRLSRSLGILETKEGDRNYAFAVINRFDFGSILAVRSFRVGRQMGVRAKPVPMLCRHVLRRVVLLMDMQQGGLLQGEQQNRTEQDRENGAHEPNILV
jgi:hypothetical protein